MLVPKIHLTDDAREFWVETQREYSVTDAAGIRLLDLAAECLMRAEQARAIIAKEGVTQTNRFGVRERHPAVTIEKDMMVTYKQLVHALRLEESDDVET